MALVSGDWFPIETMEFKGDLPGSQDFGKPIAVLARFPRGDLDWPYLFKGNHPFRSWRLPTDDELTRARHFYGIKENV